MFCCCFTYSALFARLFVLLQCNSTFFLPLLLPAHPVQQLSTYIAVQSFFFWLVRTPCHKTYVRIAPYAYVAHLTPDQTIPMLNSHVSGENFTLISSSETTRSACILLLQWLTVSNFERLEVVDPRRFPTILSTISSAKVVPSLL